ncbi:Endothelin-converting enzyme 1 [Acidimicrobium ferrooxidans DSM 10331]|uniref:Endothelin-converting enzyme 1 n=1 Tax=Acidimicrobium ferrooxidans (strain DSM 10331 / JCM 15462 / NBRC 103882 / ICP) TaxID=525909 RepID=C7LYE9_ACIFD|nr:M13-type metalloendopeptidase [Acidimicrobium ferrooxidans]ACU53757.1 Endothelin-converting enzyme 1 [Acidimicrobium ferrooxidans DSM 10331]
MVAPGIDLDDLDPTVRPQDDLFGHVNNRWFQRTAIPDDRARYGAFSELADAAEIAVRELCEQAREAPAGSEERKLGDLYASFMDAERIEEQGAAPIAPLLAAIDDVADYGSFWHLLGSLERDGVRGLVDLFVDTDPGDPSRYLVFVSQGGISLPDERYFREERFASVRALHRQHVATMFELAGLTNAAARAAAVVELEAAIAARHLDNVASRDALATYNLMTYEDLVGLVAQGHREAEAFLEAWIDGMGVDRAVVREVVVRQPAFLGSVGELFEDGRIDVWRDWLAWHVIAHSAPLLSTRFVEESFAFYGTALTGAPTLRARWKRAVSFVEGAMGEAVGRLYVARHFSEPARHAVRELVDHLLDAYRESIASLEWMREETRAEALAKLEAIVVKVGYPDAWRDYGALVVDPEDLIGNARRAASFAMDFELAKIGRPVDRSEWFMTPQTVNAYYNPGFNEIVFPAAILQPPFFDAERDAAANYGAIGAVIGHEIGHAFDDQGSRYDGEGRLRNWWTDDDRANFEHRTKALIEQYSALTPRQIPEHHVDGALTVGENIGDIGGLAIAWRAYELALDGAEPPVLEGTSGGERFFFSWAICWREQRRDEEALRLLAIDPHSPPEFRCNQAARNVDAFHQTFHTDPSSGLWLDPEERVRIWRA